MIAIIDYDAGNLKSVEKALLSLGQETVVTRDREELLDADKVILPGVGNFGDLWSGTGDTGACKKADSLSWHLSGTPAAF